MSKLFCMLAVATVIAGCAGDVTAPKPDATTCQKDAFAQLIGTNISAATLPLSLTYRVIYPNDAVTMDHAPDRLNIAVDEAGNVEALSCG